MTFITTLYYAGVCSFYIYLIGRGKMKAKFVRKVTYYYEARCSVCKTKYKSKSEPKAVEKALQCKNRSLEEKIFKKGDLVTNVELRTCSITGGKYYFKGKVVRVLGPMLPDYEYEVKWLGGVSSRVNGHVFQYEVSFMCPHCKEARKEFYYAPLLKPIH